MNPTALWLTPIIALPGIALLIISTSARYTRVPEELHHLEAHRTGPHLRRLARTLLGRAVLFRNALVGLYLCVTLFALAGVVVW